MKATLALILLLIFSSLFVFSDALPDGRATALRNRVRELEAEVARDAYGLAVNYRRVESPAARGVGGCLLQLLRAVHALHGLDLALLINNYIDRDDAAHACRARH